MTQAEWDGTIALSRSLAARCETYTLNATQRRTRDPECTVRADSSDPRTGTRPGPQGVAMRTP